MPGRCRRPRWRAGAERATTPAELDQNRSRSRHSTSSGLASRGGSPRHSAPAITAEVARSRSMNAKETVAVTTIRTAVSDVPLDEARTRHSLHRTNHGGSTGRPIPGVPAVRCQGDERRCDAPLGRFPHRPLATRTRCSTQLAVVADRYSHAHSSPRRLLNLSGPSLRSPPHDDRQRPRGSPLTTSVARTELSLAPR